MVIKLHPTHLQIIHTHAESTYPHECCGIMLGHMADDGKIVVEVWQTENAWSAETTDPFPTGEWEMTRARRYAIAPKDLLQAQRSARARHLDIIGIYHSHPDYPAIPSEFDRLCAWQQYSYIIVSVQKGKASDLRSWSLDDDHQFQPEEFVTVEGTYISNLF